MARLDRQRLDAARLPVTTRVPTRYSDLDTLGHVNNAAAALILQEARGQFDVAAGVDLLRGRLRPVVAALTIEYVAEMQFPGDVEVRSGVLQIGRSSFVLGQVGYQGGRATLYAETVLVMADADGPIAIPDDMRAAYERVRIDG